MVLGEWERPSCRQRAVSAYPPPPNDRPCLRESGEGTASLGMRGQTCVSASPVSRGCLQRTLSGRVSWVYPPGGGVGASGRCWETAVYVNSLLMPAGRRARSGNGSTGARRRSQARGLVSGFGQDSEQGFGWGSERATGSLWLAVRHLRARSPQQSEQTERHAGLGCSRVLDGGAAACGFRQTSDRLKKKKKRAPRSVSVRRLLCIPGPGAEECHGHMILR